MKAKIMFATTLLILSSPAHSYDIQLRVNKTNDCGANTVVTSVARAKMESSEWGLILWFKTQAKIFQNEALVNTDGPDSVAHPNIIAGLWYGSTAAAPNPCEATYCNDLNPNTGSKGKSYVEVQLRDPIHDPLLIKHRTNADYARDCEVNEACGGGPYN